MKRKLECENEYGDGVGWIRGRILGKGSYGSVYKASRKSEFSSLPAELAVKSAETSVSSTLWDEKEIMSHLKGCAYVIQCYGAETTVGGVMAYNLLLEYGSGGTLAHRISELWRLPEAEVRAHTGSLLMGLCHIHGLGFVHCDLKPENILLVPQGGKGFTAKIGDFGLSKRRKITGRWRGTPMYLSPESVTGREQEAPADIWALGCVVLQMLTGKRPWEGQKEEILASIGSENGCPKIPDSISGAARNFLMCCFERDPDWRLTAKSLLDHPFVDHNVSQEFEEEEDYEESQTNKSGDEFSCEEYYDDWMLSSAKIEEDFSFTRRHYSLKEGAFVGYPVAFPIAAGV